MSFGERTSGQEERQGKCRMQQCEYQWQNVFKHESNLWSHPEWGAHRSVPTETSAGQLSRHTWKNEGKLQSEQLIVPSKTALQMVASSSCHAMTSSAGKSQTHLLSSLESEAQSLNVLSTSAEVLCIFHFQWLQQHQDLVPNERLISNLTPYILTG